MSVTMLRKTDVVGSLRSDPLPSVVAAKIATFLAAGTTGQITLDVKEGRILGFKLTECGRVGHVDRNGDVSQD